MTFVAQPTFQMSPLQISKANGVKYHHAIHIWSKLMLKKDIQKFGEFDKFDTERQWMKKYRLI
jgi:hypothetical protein